MIEGNSWNHDNNQENFNRNNNNGNSYRSNNNRYNSHKNKRFNNTSNSGNQGDRQNSGNQSQTQLLQELVQQNHTIIGLLRGIKHALTETAPEQQSVKKQPRPKQVQKTSEKDEKLNTVTKAADKKENKDSSQKPRRQFVMRFDDKKPLNKDLDESLSVSEQLVEEVAEAEGNIVDTDENSIGERDPFEFFGKVNEE